jgi:hypothetical protein
MLPHLKTLLGQKSAAPAQREARAERMPPDEGMRYRREMLYQSIRESMLAMEVLSNMYKFKVVNVDQQHQVFIVMIEVSKLFEAKWNGTSASFAQAEQRLMTGAMNRAGVTLQGVFWRVDETVDAFAMPARASDGADQTGVAMRTREVPGDVSHARVRLARRSTETPAAPTGSANSAPGPSAAGGKSDIGSTQYGQL